MARASRRNVSAILLLFRHFLKFFSPPVDANQSNAAAPVNGKANSPGLSHDILDQIQRPSVDSLLDELSNARSVSPVYSVPHDGDGKPKAGRHVTITVRETTTERMSGTPSQCELFSAQKYVVKSFLKSGENFKQQTFVLHNFKGQTFF